MIGGTISCWEVGAIGNEEIISEVAGIEWGWGWYSIYSCMPGSDVTIMGGNGAVWMACAQLVSYALLGEVVF